MQNHKINVLYIPQFSMNDGKNVFITKDGNFIVLKTFIKNLNVLQNVHTTLLIAIPPRNYICHDELHQFTQGITSLKSKNVDLMLCSFDDACYNISPIKSRFLLPFNTHTFEKIINFHKINLIINNIPELSKNIYSLLSEHLDVKIISCFHFCEHLFSNKLTEQWKNGSKIGYDLRQFDALMCSDYNIFNCHSEIEECFGHIKQGLSGQVSTKIIDIIKEKTTHLSYVDFSDYEMILGANTQENNSSILSNVIGENYSIFPARITASGYTNWLQCFMTYYNKSLPIVFCNPSGKKGIDCINQFVDEKIAKAVQHGSFQLHCANPNYIDVYEIKYLKYGSVVVFPESIPKQVYYILGGLSSFIVNLYINEKYGGISIRELLSASKGTSFPIVPNVGEFRKWNNIIKSQYNNYEQYTLTDVNSFEQNLSSIISLILNERKLKNSTIYNEIKRIENWDTTSNNFAAMIDKLKIKE